MFTPVSSSLRPAPRQNMGRRGGEIDPHLVAGFEKALICGVVAYGEDRFFAAAVDFVFHELAQVDAFYDGSAEDALARGAP
jgi:hypothetical protein